MSAIRPAVAADAPALAEVHAAAFGRGWRDDDLAALLAAPGALALLAEARGSGAVLGFALARSAAEEAELLTLAVRPPARRRGLARALMAALLDALAGGSVETLFLEVGEDNAAARALYDGLGFRPVARRPGYYRRPVGDADALVLAIAPAGWRGRAGGSHADQNPV